MNQKDLIKWGLIALGAYLVYKYIEEQGGLAAVLGTGTPALPSTTTPTTTSKTVASVPIPAHTATPASTTTTTTSTPPPATAPAPSTASAPQQNVSQSMATLAIQAGAGSSLSMDQWCFYYTQVTGQGCPFDPGAVDPSVYAGAGIVDRTTPTDVGTWLAIAQNQAPQLGLTGMGAFSIPRYAAPWLM